MSKVLTVTKDFAQELGKNRVMFLMLLPAIIYFLVFHYAVMPGAYVAFVDYNINRGIFKSEFIGFKNFEFLVKSGSLWLITKNTILYNIVFLGLGNLIQIVFAVMLSEIGLKWYKKLTQSVVLLPYFISMVIVGVFSFSFFSYDSGFVNNLLRSLGLEKIDFYSNVGIWKYIIVGFKLWSATGYGMIVYLATIAGISTEIYEAAFIDGANTWKKLRYITVPMLKPTFILLFLFGLGGVLKGSFDLFYNIIGNNSVLYPQTDIIDTFVFRSLVGQFNFSMGAAVGLYQSIFGLLLVFTVNVIIRKVEPESALF